jgi:hypothetical protein
MQMVGFNGGIDSLMAKWFARGVIPGIVAISLAIFSWNATRAIDTLDLHSEKLESISERVTKIDQQLVGIDGKVTLFQQFLDLMKRQSDSDARNAREAQADHETRIRQLEKTR